jgi:hypothetical protein
MTSSSRNSWREEAAGELHIAMARGASGRVGCETLAGIKVRRFRIGYEPDRKARLVRIFAVGHRLEVYEEVAEQLRQGRERE